MIGGALWAFKVFRLAGCGVNQICDFFAGFREKLVEFLSFFQFIICNFPFDSIWFIEVQLVFPVVKVFRESQSFLGFFLIDGQLIRVVQFFASSD